VTGVFYTLAVLFLFSPTCNPWYFLWAIPFLPWARQASWFLLPLVVLQYYLRFWFVYHYPPGAPVPGTDLDGQAFFDDVWVWFEYVPFLMVLAGEMLWRYRAGKTRQRHEANKKIEGRARSALPSEVSTDQPYPKGMTNGS
jgi:hypothetical protein